VLDDLVGDPRRKEAADLLGAEGTGGLGEPVQEHLERVDRCFGRTAVAKLGGDPRGTDLVELVDRDEHAGAFLGRKAEDVEHGIERATVVDAHARTGQPQRVERVERR
jgi:hypothetical protein